MYINGQPYGLGNKIEELLNLEVYCINNNTQGFYYWNNVQERSYPILVNFKHITIQSESPYKDASTLPCFLDNPILPTRQEILMAVKNMCIKLQVSKTAEPYLGIHIRRTDRIQNSPLNADYMDANTANSLLERTARFINYECPKNLFICSDDERAKEELISKIKKPINIINPLGKNDYPLAYQDWYALANAYKIIMCSKLSSFSATASLVNNIPLVSFFAEEETSLVRIKPNTKIIKRRNLLMIKTERTTCIKVEQIKYEDFRNYSYSPNKDTVRIDTNQKHGIAFGKLPEIIAAPGLMPTTIKTASNPAIQRGVTLLMLDSVDKERSDRVFQRCLSMFKFADAKLLSPFPKQHWYDVTIEPVSLEGYSEFMVKNVGDYFSTPHCLIVQWDGFIVNPGSWTDTFLDYDYIGAPIPPSLLSLGGVLSGFPKEWGIANPDKCVICNGGFSLRSKRLYDALSQIIEPQVFHPEDLMICGYYRTKLEGMGIKFPPLNVARKFAVEYGDVIRNQFGQHDGYLDKHENIIDRKTFGKRLDYKFPD